MTPVLLAFDESKFATQKEGAEILINEVQNIVDTFNAFGFEPLKNNELHTLFFNPNELLFDKVTKGQPISISGIEIDKVKAMEFIKKPEGYETFESKKSNVVKKVQDIGTDYHLKNAKTFSKDNIKNVFEIDVKGIVSIKQIIFDELKRSNELYATSPEAVKMYELAVMVCEKCKEPEISEAVRNNGDGLHKVIKGLFKEHVHGKEPSIDITAILKYNQPGYKF